MAVEETDAGIRVDRVRAQTVSRLLLRRMRANGYPYCLPEAQPPQIDTNLPGTMKRGGVEHANFLFILCYWMRGGIESDTAITSLARLHDDHPYIFRPRAARMIHPAFITGLLRAYNLGFSSDEIGRHWVHNARRLDELYGGSAIALFDGVSDYATACERIRNHRGNGFRGFQEKMVSMLIYFLLDSGLITGFPHPIPVDFHVLRTLVSTEILVWPNAPQGNHYHPKLLQVARRLLQDYCETEQVDPRDLCNALWLFSRTFCRHHPGNKSAVGERHGRKTPVGPTDIAWTIAQRRSYDRYCGHCPIESFCRWQIPSAPYYIQGRLITRGPRAKPPQGSLGLWHNPP